MLGMCIPRIRCPDFVDGSGGGLVVNRVLKGMLTMESSALFFREKADRCSLPANEILNQNDTAVAEFLARAAEVDKNAERAVTASPSAFLS